MEKLCVIKIRTSMKKNSVIQKTEKALGLGRMYSCVITDKSDQYMGMLKVVESIITYGEVDKDTFKLLLKKRSEISNKRGFEWDQAELDKFADAFFDGKKKLSDAGIKRTFRLHPPIKGFERKGKKVPYTMKGAFGYRGNNINDLLKRMI